jgi:histidine triad (HIT) family protein
MAEETVFDRILRGEIPADIVYEDEHCLAFRDIAPKAPVHVLIIPRQRLDSLQNADADHTGSLGHLLASGFRCVINAGDDGGQEVPYLHVHLLGGRPLSWPPG